MSKIGLLIAVLQVLSGYENGATAGKIARVLPMYSKSQVERVLKDAVGEGGVYVEFTPYRPNIMKRVYHLDESLVDKLESIVKTYDSTLHLVALPIVKAME